MTSPPAIRAASAGLLALLLLAGCSSGSGNETTPPQPETTQASTPPPPASKPAEPKEPTEEPAEEEPAEQVGAVVGLKTSFPIGDQLEASVTKVQDGLSRVGPKSSGMKAQGQFVLVTVSVENVGNEADSLMMTQTQLIDDQGNTYESDLSAGVWANNNKGPSALADVNPGSKASEIYVFDIKKKATPVTFTLNPYFGDESAQITVQLQ